MIKVKIILLLVVSMVILPLSAQNLTEAPAKPENLASGVLENGMHYYVLHNEEPKDRVSFYFAQNSAKDSFRRGNSESLVLL